MIVLRAAQMDEAERCYQMIQEARMYQRTLGFDQWPMDYPTLETVKEDILAGNGYAFEADGRILGYCCIMFGDDPTYQVIEGAWKTDRPYGVVHRMGFGDESRGSGLSREAFRLIREFCISRGVDAMRIDTHEKNKVMQHIVAREGFEYCGIIYFDGSPRLAYELDL